MPKRLCPFVEDSISGLVAPTITQAGRDVALRGLRSGYRRRAKPSPQVDLGNGRRRGNVDEGAPARQPRLVLDLAFCIPVYTS
jgi:hypothetical protein